jgi:formylglycine-generating enzyme required for sulfatase activity
MKGSGSFPTTRRVAPSDAVRALALAALTLLPACAVTHVPQAPAPGTAFRDAPECPEMVVVPPGRFVMGSAEADRRRLGVLPRFDRMESPQHEVGIARAFAVGRYSVTFAEWDTCVAAGGCRGHVPDDQGWGRGRRPVINVNWHDAMAYVDWLRQRTGQPYRLLSEAQWEYAARAGTTTAYYSGPALDPSQANFGRTLGRSVEVGSYPPNAFGLYDMTGNTAQWVEDCHHESYAGAPTDGSAWLAEDCSLRNVRGGAWSLSGWSVRTAQRIGDPIEMRNDHLGFRVARDLNP